MRRQWTFPSRSPQASTKSSVPGKLNCFSRCTGQDVPLLTLYGDLDSGNVYKVRLVLAQLAIAYRRVDTTQNRGETSTAEFRAINPMGKIPTMVFDDGRMLSESGAILYLLALGRNGERDFHGEPRPTIPWLDQPGAAVPPSILRGPAKHPRLAKTDHLGAGTH